MCTLFFDSLNFINVSKTPKFYFFFAFKDDCSILRAWSKNCSFLFLQTYFLRKYSSSVKQAYELIRICRGSTPLNFSGTSWPFSVTPTALNFYISISYNLSKNKASSNIFYLLLLSLRIFATLFCPTLIILSSMSIIFFFDYTNYSNVDAFGF